MVAVRVFVVPFFSDKEVGLTDIFATDTITFTVQVAFRPFGALAVMTAVPPLRPFTFPFWSTEATVLSDVDLWGRDLREITGLEDRIASVIADVQAAGFRQALKSLKIKEQW